MTEKKNTGKEDDPKQSEAFRKAVRDLEAAGELNDAQGGKALDEVLRKPETVKAKLKSV